MPKIISECRELVKLCGINCSGPVFFETHCISSAGCKQQQRYEVLKQLSEIESEILLL